MRTPIYTVTPCFDSPSPMAYMSSPSHINHACTTKGIEEYVNKIAGYSMYCKFVIYDSGIIERGSEHLWRPIQSQNTENARWGHYNLVNTQWLDSGTPL